MDLAASANSRESGVDPQPYSNALLWATLAGMILGALFGALLGHAGLSEATRGVTIEALNLVTTIFLRLLQMIVAPLILTTLVVGVSQMDGAGTLGLVSLRTLLWFLVFSLFAITIGLVLADFFAPGQGLNVAMSEAARNAEAKPIDIFKMIQEIVPVSIVDASAHNKILQIVVFAVFVGMAIGALGEGGALVRQLAEQIAAIMFKVAGVVIRIAPVAVFAAMASTTLEHGVGMVATLGLFVAQFYLGLFIMAMLIACAGALFIGRRMIPLVGRMREPLLIAFSTASSEATFPSAFKAIQSVGVSPKIVGLILPLGYSFNLDGTLVYSAFTVMFIAQAYGIDLSVQQQIGILLFLLLANKGAAGVPRGALVMMTITLQSFGLPVEGIALIFGVEAILDMGRTTINVFGNAVATASIARMSGELGPHDESRAGT